MDQTGQNQKTYVQFAGWQHYCTSRTSDNVVFVLMRKVASLGRSLLSLHASCVLLDLVF